MFTYRTIVVAYKQLKNNPMKKLFISSYLMLYFINVQSQQILGRIEIRPYVRCDWYPEFSYNIGGRPSTDYLKIEEISWGFNAYYRYPTKKGINFKGGLGYYKYSFTTLENYNTHFGSADARIIIYPSFFQPTYATNNYYYNNIAINLGIEKIIKLKNDLFIVSGIELNNYCTVSQAYHMTFQGSQPYKNTSSRFFGHSVTINFSLLKQIKETQIGPILILPVFDNWKKDSIFPGENSSEYRNKWFNGIGFGISFNF